MGFVRCVRINNTQKLHTSRCCVDRQNMIIRLHTVAALTDIYWYIHSGALTLYLLRGSYSVQTSLSRFFLMCPKNSQSPIITFN